MTRAAIQARVSTALLTTAGYGAVRVYREYTASAGRGENVAAVEAELEGMARESVLAFIAAEPWALDPVPPEGVPRPGRVITTFDPEAA